MGALDKKFERLNATKGGINELIFTYPTEIEGYSKLSSYMNELSAIALKGVRFMDSTIIAGIIGAIAVIIAAIIKIIFPIIFPKRKKIDISPYQFFILGTNIAKIGWGKVFPSPEIENIQVLTISMLDKLNIPKAVNEEFDIFLSKNETVKELTTTLPHIKNLFGTYFLSNYGKNNARYYYIGFNLVNICPMFEIASLQIQQVGPIVENQLKDIIKIAKELNLPCQQLKNIMKEIKSGISSNQGKYFDIGRQKLMDVGEKYINILSKKEF